jgi:hypothetical protein
VTFRWSRKAARNFLTYATSPKCVAETGIRVREGRPVSCQNEGHSKGHSKGHTYLIGLARDSAHEGHPKGHSKGHSIKKEVSRKETDMGHGVARVRQVYEPEFEQAWVETPYRLGNNPKIAAAKAWRARRKEGVAAEALLDATKRYAAFCDATGLTGTPHVMLAATFFGPNRPFDQEWECPHPNGNGRHR